MKAKNEKKNIRKVLQSAKTILKKSLRNAKRQKSFQKRAKKTEIWPSWVHITNRDPKLNRHRDRDNLWTKIFPF